MSEITSSTSVDSAPSTESTQTTETTPLTTQPLEPRKFKVKIDGNEAEVDEAELLRGYQTAQSANKKFQETAQLRKQTEAFVDMMRNGHLFEVAQQLGLNPQDLAEQWLMQKIEYENLSPEEKQLREYKKQLEEYQTKEKQTKEEQERQRQAQLQAQYAQHYEKEVVSALNTAGLPKTPSTVKRMAYYLQQGINRGMELKASDVVDLVKRDYMAEINEVLGSVTDDNTILSLLGGTADRIRKADLNRLKNNSKPQYTSNSTSAKKQSKPKTKSWDDVEASLLEDIGDWRKG